MRHHENRRHCRADYGSAARVTTPLRSLVTRAASRRRSPSARHSPVTGAASRRSCGPAGRVSPAHRGPQAPRTARSRPWRREFDGSLCRGGQGLWTLWTADSDLGRGFERRARDYYTVIIGGRWIWRGYLPGSGGSGGRRHFYPSGQGEDAGGCRRDQSSFGSRMVMTGSPSSPGPTTSFSLVSSASVARPSRGTR